MAKRTLRDEEVEQEIHCLERSPMVKLARRYDAVREQRREYLQELRRQERRGCALADAGITMEMLGDLMASDYAE